MNLKGKKIAIFVAELYQELEAWYPHYRFKEGGVSRNPDDLPAFCRTIMNALGKSS